MDEYTNRIGKNKKYVEKMLVAHAESNREIRIISLKWPKTQTKRIESQTLNM